MRDSEKKLNKNSTLTLAEFATLVAEKVQHVDDGLITLEEAISQIVIKSEEF